jgi:hypothetical protein
MALTDERNAVNCGGELERIARVEEKLVGIARECVRVINTQPTAPFVVLRGKLPQAGWPRGKCIGSDSKGKFMAYDAKRLLAALAAKGIVKVEIEPRP